MNGLWRAPNRRN